MRRTLKPILAALAALALLWPAAPASATTGTITGGTLSVNLIPALSVPLGSGGCGTSTLDVVTSGAGPANATTTLEIDNVGFDYNNSSYVLDGVKVGTATNAGTVTTGTGTPLTTGPFATVTAGNIYAASTPGGCTPTGPALCSGVGLGVPALSLSGSFTGTVSAPGLTGTASSVGGSGRVVASGCVAPFAALNGRTLTLSGVTATF